MKVGTHVDRNAQRRPEPELRRHAPDLTPLANSSNAQRRPEPELRRHRCARAALRPSPRTLNEGRSRNSGDTREPSYVGSGCSTGAQRRPEPELRRHRPTATCSSHTRASPLNEGRSRNSGDTLNFHNSMAWFAEPLNEGRSRNSGDTTAAWLNATVPDTSLNEGRSRNSGDTRPRSLRSVAKMHAQRRPEPELRRHVNDVAAVVIAGVARSTKAGAGTPATPHVSLEPQRVATFAQRRPEPELRRHS